MLKRKIIGGVAALMIIVGCSTNTESNEKLKTKDELSSVGEMFNYKILGVEPGSGVNGLIEKAIKDYNLNDWKLIESSSAAMIASLEKASVEKEPIVVAAWTPHWMMEKYDLKFLNDPKKSCGKPGNMHTLTRLGFEKDQPNSYKLLQQFEWELKDLTKVMSMIEEGMDPEAASEKWMKENENLVNKWLEGVEQVEGEKITLVYVAFQDNISSSYVVAKALKEKGYDVSLMQVDVAPAFLGVADGSADVYVGAVLPDLHASYFNKYKDKLVDVGANLEGTYNCVAVPKYMNDINSIEDLGKMADQLGKQ